VRTVPEMGSLVGRGPYQKWVVWLAEFVRDLNGMEVNTLLV